MIYLFTFALPWLSSFLTSTRQNALIKRVAFTVVGFIAVLAIARGDVGTDTHAYESLVRVHLYASRWLEIEPGFIAYVRLAHLASDNAVIITRGLSAVFAGLMLIYLWRASRDEIFVLLAYFAPNYLVQMSMNGLRIGVATAAFLCAVQLFRRGRAKHATLYAALALSFHISILFAILLMILTSVKFSRAKTMFIPIFGGLLVAIITITAQSYIESKFATYTTITTPSVFSGLSPVGRILIILFFAAALPIHRADKFWIFATLLVATAFSYQTAFSSYAGLRMLEIIASIVPFLLLAQIPPSTKLNQRFRFGVGLAGFLGGLNSLRGVFASADLPGTPFVPYHFLNQTIIGRG